MNYLSPIAYVDDERYECSVPGCGLTAILTWFHGNKTYDLCELHRRQGRTARVRKTLIEKRHLHVPDIEYDVLDEYDGDLDPPRTRARAMEFG